MRTIMTTIRKKWKALNRVTPPSRSPTGALYRCRPSQRGPQLFRFIGRNVIRCNRIQQDIYFISLIRGVWWGILWAEWSPFSRPPPPFLLILEYSLLPKKENMNTWFVIISSAREDKQYYFRVASVFDSWDQGWEDISTCEILRKYY